MKKIIAVLAAIALTVSVPAVASANGFQGGLKSGTSVAKNGFQGGL